MAIPAVNIIWDDQSQINRTDGLINEDNIDRPIVMTVITADKGPEEWRHKVFGKEFYELYGTELSFARHGQPLIQAANVIDAGGYLTVRRVMPDDAKLANLSVYASVTYSQVAYLPTNTPGIYLWQHNTNPANQVVGSVNPAGTGSASGTTNDSPSTDVNGYQKVKVNEVNVTFVPIAYNLTGSGFEYNNPTEYANVLYNQYKNTGGVGSNNQTYALFTITDNGRGVSKKRFRISRDTTASKPVQYVRYFLEVMEDDQTLETLAFTMDPSVIEKDVNMSLKNVIHKNSKQLRCVFFEDQYKNMCDNIATLLNWSGIPSGGTIGSGGVGTTTPSSLNVDEFYRADTLFGTDFYGKQIQYLNVTNPLNNVYGHQLQNGDNGSFNAAGVGFVALDPNYPTANGKYIAAVKNAFNGNGDAATNFIVPGDDIYDFDNNRIDAIFDSNYPDAIKRSIEELAAFREDFVYFRDMGVGLKNLASIEYANTNNLKNRYCATYANSYDIYDPYTRKQISVTVMYDLARLFVGHFINGRSRPFCGIKYGIIIPLDNMVPGTLNFTPKRTPTKDQRQVFDDERINYLSFYDGSILAMNSEYTSQTDYTQLSWINNVLAVQQVIKAIRVLCPKIRYSFLDGEDLQRYKQDVNELIIDKYSSLFKSFTIEYVENSQYDSNKIIYAILRVQFRNFIQTEIFKIIALPS